MVALRKEEKESSAREIALAPKPQPKVKNVGTVGWFNQSLHRSKREVFSEVKTVTPQLAEMLLTMNAENRSLREAKLAQLVADMREGRYVFNGEAIIFAKTGELNDGQHRLTAIVESKVSLPMMFVFGVERESRTSLDQGASRSPGDYLRMEGVQYASSLAAVARMMIAYERADKKSMGRAGTISSAQVMDRAKTDITLPTSAKYGQNHAGRMKGMASSSIIGFCHNVLLNIDAQDGMAFMEMLCVGENITRDDPAFKARDRLRLLKHLSPASRVEIIFRAWNAYREKRTLTTIPIHGRLPPLV